jgi:hypothetical protein
MSAGWILRVEMARARSKDACDCIEIRDNDD